MVKPAPWEVTRKLRLIVFLRGWAKWPTEDGRELYVFRCPEHGYVLSVPHYGEWGDELRCPECIKDRIRATGDDICNGQELTNWEP